MKALSQPSTNLCCVPRLVVLLVPCTWLTPALAEPPQTDRFYFEWVADGTSAGGERSTHVVRPFVVEFRNEPVEIPDLTAARSLLHEYGVALNDEETPWRPRCHAISP